MDLPHRDVSSSNLRYHSLSAYAAPSGAVDHDSDNDGDMDGYDSPLDVDDGPQEATTQAENSEEQKRDAPVVVEEHGRAENGEDTGTSTPSDNTEHGFLPRDKQTKTAYYDYALEKQTSHAEAKQFYQRHQLESTGPSSLSQHGYGPIGRSKTFPLKPVGDAGQLSRAGSLRSLQGYGGAARNDVVYRSALPVGIVDSGKSPQAAEAQTLGSVQFNSTQPHNQGDDAVVQADVHARSPAMHPGLPYEYKPPMLATEGIQGAGAGVGVGAGAGGFANSDDVVSSELSAIYTNIQKVLDIRHKYIRLSLQGPMDNPKDEPGWLIYPQPLEPVGDQYRGQLAAQDQSSSLSNSGVLPAMSRDPGGYEETPKLKRKPGHNIGEDFSMEDLEPLPETAEMTFRLDANSVFQVYETSQSADFDTPIVSIPTIREFYMDLDAILNTSSDGPSKSFAYRRLQYLEGKFNLYYLLNEYQEMADSKRVPHRDFYNVRKVDTHVHHSACMNQKHLLRFIKSKLKKCPDEVVLYRDGKLLTLKEVFESIKLTAYDLSIDTLDMHAHTDSFHRFDKFNLKYNPVGESRLRTIFLKTDNYINGRYLAEITKEVISDLESGKYQMVEWRISIYGRTLGEWDKLAAWVVDNKLFSHNVRWLIQVPRLYDVYKSAKLMENFEQVVINVFQPLFEVTKDPRSHPKLHVFLQRVIGFDSVDDESKVERRLYRKFPLPRDWNTKQNPPYSYWIYYLFANIASLNVWRKQRGFNTFLLRPHCGEAGDTDHLAAAVLCCHSISHGLLLRKVPLLQYIFYLDQIGIAMSPLSNNALFLAYERNPFLQYFRRGLNVSLSTDDPLQFAFTKEPLIEEYAVAAQIYKLSAVDMSELAKNSVEQSGYEHVIKQRWLGPDYRLPGVLGNNVAKTNVPNVREAFRHETWLQEHSMIERYTGSAAYLEPLSASNFPPQTPQSKANQVGFASPSISMRAHPSATNPLDSQQFSLPRSALPPQSQYTSTYPAQVAGVAPSLSSSHIAGLGQSHRPGTTNASTNGSADFCKAGQPSSPAMSSHPQDQLQSMDSSHLPQAQEPLLAHHPLELHEPKIFPGVVTRQQRRSSIAASMQQQQQPPQREQSRLNGNQGLDTNTENTKAGSGDSLYRLGTERPLDEVSDRDEDKDSDVDG